MNAPTVLQAWTSGQPPLSSAAMAAAGWRRVDGGKGKIGARWLHDAGWRLEHCGHPTALRPWALFAPAGGMVCTGAAGRTPNATYGTAWPDLRLAVAFVASPGARAFARITPERGR